nr:photosystem I subunit X [Cryptomonas borealis]
MYTNLLISIVPQTAGWSAKIATIMILSNIICIITSKYTTQLKGSQNSLFLNGSFKNFTLPELIASTSLGHMVGIGIVLGLGYIGALT